MSFAPEPTASGVLPPDLTVERATPADADIFLEIHEEAARWLWERGIRQWRPGAFQREWLDAPISRGELYIARLDCIANNPTLCAYYEHVGYTRVDDLAVEGEGKANLARFEKRVTDE